ncbi:Ligand-binding domain of nuclear hormone receptor [Trichostrongylus colubriformis]|uniref:Ligand-binding domain of nuclear hormone receptor n=1 Tax=Trichostrongylus colubriformis TaxID=6319 RepID=A0AAN8IEG5_TRICO
MEHECGPVCTICGSAGAQTHYRAMACGSCKVFFVRTLKRDVPFVCDNNGKCIVNKVNRNVCKACRFAKCLQMKMTVEDVGRLKRNSPHTDHEQSVVPHMRNSKTVVETKKITGGLSIGVHFLQELEKSSLGAKDYAKTLISMEKMCENHEASRTTFDYSLDITLAEALERPHLCCHRTPIGWNQEEFAEADNLLDMLKQIYCRTVTLFADFANGFPELAQLNGKDRLNLCNTNYCGVVLFTLVYNAYLGNFYGILFPHGFKYSLLHKKGDDEFNEFMHELVDYLHRHVVVTFRETNITHEEYSFVKSLILFSGVTDLTEAGQEVVKTARRKYGALLSDYVTETRPEMSPLQRMERLSKLLGTIPHMMHASDFDNVYCARMVVMNIGNLSGTLSYDLHIRKF